MSHDDKCTATTEQLAAQVGRERGWSRGGYAGGGQYGTESKEGWIDPDGNVWDANEMVHGRRPVVDLNQRPAITEQEWRDEARDKLKENFNDE